MFDATDLEVARRTHDYEMGAESLSERAWYRFYDAAEAAIVARGWDEKFTGEKVAGKSRGLDSTDHEAGFSIDGAHDAFRARWSVERYVASVERKRAELGL